MPDVRLEYGVPGPKGQLGLLLVAPRSAALDRDLRHQIAPWGLCWMENRQGWWIAYPYRDAARDILEHSFPSMN